MTDRRTLTLGVAAIFIVSLFAGAGSLAYFSDLATSTGNTFIAGTFGIELIPGETLPFLVRNIVPGWSDVEIHGVKNIGTLAGEVWITAENFVEPTGYGVEPEPDDTEMSADDFAKILFMRISIDMGSPLIEIYDGPIYGMETTRFAIDPNEVIYLAFEAYLPTDLDNPLTVGVNEDDNLYQADGVSCDIVFHGTTEITIG